MYRKLLVPVESKDESGPAIDAAAELARAGGGELRLLHVIQTIPGLGAEEDRDFYERLETAAREQLSLIGEDLTGREVTCSAETRIGSRVRGILDAARESLRASKSWLRLSVEDWDLGIGEVKRLLDAYEAYYAMKGVEVAMELEYNLSLARVASSLGDVNLYLKWVEAGRAAF